MAAKTMKSDQPVSNFPAHILGAALQNVHNGRLLESDVIGNVSLRHAGCDDFLN